MKEKIEKTKRLIRYSDKPVTAIAAYLRFSSQSHFSNTFHKYTKISLMNIDKNIINNNFCFIEALN